MEKRYKLLKDLPDSKAGDVYVLCDDDKEWPPVYYKNGNQEESYWLQKHVENSPDWFSEVKSENKSIDSFQWTEELVMQCGERYYINQRGEKMVTEKELLDAEMKAFNAAKQIRPQEIKGRVYEYPYYPTFSDYKKLNYR